MQLVTSDCSPVFMQPWHCVPSLPSSPCSSDNSQAAHWYWDMCIIFLSISYQDFIEEMLVWDLCCLCRKPSSWWQSDCEDKEYCLACDRSLWWATAAEQDPFSVLQYRRQTHKLTQAQIMWVEYSQVILLEISFHLSFIIAKEWSGLLYIRINHPEL